MLGELSLFRLQVFVTLVERGGYSAAAAQLDVAQPTVSFHVRALERALGARLVTYRDRAVHLTPEGEALFRTAKAMLRDGEQLAQAIEHIQAGQDGTLTLGASMAFEQPFFFERVVAPFARKRPRAALSLRFGHSMRLARAVLEHELDLAIVLDWRLPAGVQYEPLHRADFVFVAAQSHPLARRRDVTAAAVAEAGIIIAPIGDAETVAYGELLRASGLRGQRVALEVDGIQARVLAARAGLGVLGIFVPPYAGELAFNGLAPLRLPGPPPSTEFGLVNREGRPWTPLMTAFAAWLREVSSAAGHLPPAKPPSTLGG
ncbi:MAG TPA: LysR family transcriptional regulator [Dehalococcoidia bacterium]|nr:LysR family transcriptional regulator [Dehalococcoidia bacterium]